MPPDRQPSDDALPPESALSLLATGNAREVLARIVPEDPLGLRARVGRQLVARALLLDVERVLLCAQAQCAMEAPGWRGEPELACWLERCVERALGAVLAEERADVESRAVDSWSPFAGPLALDPRALASACARFNRLASEEREAFIALLLGARVERSANGRSLSLSELGRRARPGLQLFVRAAGVQEAASRRAAVGG
jgi:hypothetical protein